MKIIPLLLVAFLACASAPGSTGRVMPSHSDSKDEKVIQVTGYYKSMLGDTAHWNPISLKLKVRKSGSGETYEVASYKLPFEYGWKELYYGGAASTVQGYLSDKYSHSASVAGYTVYFSLC
jgi:hypothetical protein